MIMMIITSIKSMNYYNINNHDNDNYYSVLTYNDNNRTIRMVTIIMMKTMNHGHNNDNSLNSGMKPYNRLRGSIPLYMYACYICIFIYTHITLYMYVCCMYTLIYIYINMCIYTHIYTFTHICICICIRLCVCL